MSMAEIRQRRKVTPGTSYQAGDSEALSDLHMLLHTPIQSLPSRLQQWQAQLHDLRPEAARESLSKVRAKLDDAMVQMYHQQQRSHESSADLVRLETLNMALRSLCSIFDAPIPVDAQCKEPSLSALEMRMVASGWCPNHVHMCRSVFGLTAMVFSSQLQRPFQRTHHSCTSLQCVAYKVEDRYVTRHRMPDCSCAHVVAEAQTVRNLIEQDSIPIVKFTTTSTGDLTISLEPYDSTKPFIAISHVWSHGMANALQNSLPRCQVERVANFVSRISSSPHYFWLDTLCVPREPFELRRVAIQGIRRVYEEASSVLVLDEELMACNHQNLPYEAKLMMINMSGWIRRLWTLHEHIRARLVQFQFADGTCTDLDLLRCHSDDIESHKLRGIPYHNVVAFRAVTLLANASAFKTEMNGPRRMARLWYLLRWRHLSWPEDETILMLNMLGLTPKAVNQLLKVRKRQRMQKFLDVYNEFPAELLFLQVPKLDQHGKRWAPASWLHCMEHLSEQSSVSADLQTMAVHSRDGLLVRCQYVMLAQHDITMFATSRRNCLHIRNKGILFVVRGFQAHRYNTRRRLANNHSLAICLECRLIHQEGQQVRGAMVALAKSSLCPKKRPIAARFIRNVLLTTVGPEKCSSGFKECQNPAEDHDLDCCDGTYVDELQAWYIS